MRYVSIDIETTGLHKCTHQILEIAAIAQELGGKELERWHQIIRYDEIVGHCVALRMNIRLLYAMDERYDELPDEETALERFLKWVRKYTNGDSDKVVVAGKNFASFDGPFITEHLLDHGIIEPEDKRWYHRRVLDPCNFFLHAEDDVPPDLMECLRRAGIAPANYNTHQAMDCAAAVRDLIEWNYSR